MLIYENSLRARLRLCRANVRCARAQVLDAFRWMRFDRSALLIQSDVLRRLFARGLALFCLSERVLLLSAQPEAHFLNAADTFRPKILKLEVVATREP